MLCRAEKSFTNRHLCEFTGLDFEMAINQHYNEVMDVMDHVFVSMFKSLQNNYGTPSCITVHFPLSPYIPQSLGISCKVALQIPMSRLRASLIACRQQCVRAYNMSLTWVMQRKSCQTLQSSTQLNHCSI